LRRKLDFDPNDLENKECNAHPVNKAGDIAWLAKILGKKILEPKANAQCDYAWNS